MHILSVAQSFCTTVEIVLSMILNCSKIIFTKCIALLKTDKYIKTLVHICVSVGGMAKSTRCDESTLKFAGEF